MRPIKIYYENYRVYVSIACLLVVNLFLGLHVKRIHLKIDSITEVCENKLERFKNAFVKDFKCGANSNLIYLSHSELCEDASSQKIKLIYSFAQNECEKCLAFNLWAIKENMFKQHSDDVCIVPVFEGSRNNKLKLKAILDGFNYVRLEEYQANLPFRDERDVSFMAILTEDGDLVNVFYPDSSLPEKTYWYLDFVLETYF